MAQDTADTERPPALELAEKFNDDLTSLEDDLEHVLESQRRLARGHDELKRKVSDFIIDYRRSEEAFESTLNHHGALLEQLLAKLRTPK